MNDRINIITTYICNTSKVISDNESILEIICIFRKIAYHIIVTDEIWQTSNVREQHL